MPANDAVNLLLTYSLTHSLHGAGYYLESWLALSSSKNTLPIS